MDKEKIKKTAIKSVKSAGSILLSNLDKSKKVFSKNETQIFTDIDLACEREMMKVIWKEFPDHSIMSEEGGLVDKKSEYLWVIDPLDGTVNYCHGLSPFCVGLSLLEKNNLIFNVVYLPLENNMYIAQQGDGAILNSKKITSSQRSLKEAVIFTHIPSNPESRTKILGKLGAGSFKGVALRSNGSGIASLALVAQGVADAFFTIKTNPWDILPGALLVREAGGIITDIRGNEINDKSTSVLATNGKFHTEMLELLKDI